MEPAGESGGDVAEFVRDRAPDFGDMSPSLPATSTNFPALSYFFGDTSPSVPALSPNVQALSPTVGDNAREPEADARNFS